MITPIPLPQPFIPLNSPEANLATVGGKGVNLIRLANAGFPVPDGFLIPTSAYREYVQNNNLDAFIQDSLNNLDFASPQDLQTASDAIRTQFRLGAVSRGLVAALEIAYRWLGTHPVAVRSSATAEDLPDMSFAGQQDTFLNIIGQDALLKAVIQCWSSLWTARAIGYRARNGIPHEGVSLAVVVQNMVQSDASGVLFTANPLTGKRGEIVIDATFGLGEALVSGMVEPDHYVVSHFPGAMHLGSASHLGSRITHKSLGAKATVIRSQSSGGVSIDHAVSNSGYAQRQAIPNGVILQL
ncbi:MAG: hypothetical protein KKD28_03690, partial [Chloroflexi bacterium]|nr:hypothetical protein [Chloroflexota bacterium]